MAVLLCEIPQGDRHCLRLYRVELGGCSRLALHEYETIRTRKGDVWAPTRFSVGIPREGIPALVAALQAEAEAVADRVAA